MRNKITDKKIVYVDGSSLVNNPQAGIGQYTTELINQLNSHPQINIIVLLFRNEKIHLNNQRDVKIEHLPISRKLYSVIWKFFLPLNIHLLLQYKNPDFIVYPNFAPLPYLKASHTKILTVIHDLAYLHFPETIERKNKFFLHKAVQRSAAVSDYIFFPSDFSRSDFQQHYQTNALLKVAHPGYTKKPQSTTISEITLETVKKPFILFLGTIEPRKNVEKLCAAYLKSDFFSKDIPLVVAGKNGWGNVTIPANNNIINLGIVSDSERNILLEKSTAFVFPSIFEGFGMPLIEAMRHNTPVVASLNSSMKEIINRNNAYCIEPPHSEKDILTQLQLLSSNLDKQPIVVKNKLRAAYDKSRNFTWEKCADPYIEVILK